MNDWDDILARYGPSVWRSAYRLLGDADEAEDCLQEVFLSVFELARREAIRNWPAILKATTTSRALDRLRRRVRGANALRAIARNHVRPAEPGPGQMAETSELTESLRRALARIPADHARVFCLCSMTDLSHREVAELLGTSPGAVAVTLHRARAQLRKLLRNATVHERL